MKFSILLLLLLVSNASLQAIGFYQPGDTLYIWAVSGLTLRKEASLKAAKLATIPYGALVVAQNYPYDDKVEVEAVPAHSSGGQKSPAVTLEGSFAKIVFQGDTGYVWRFRNINCEYKILYLPEERMTVITSVCSC